MKNKIFMSILLLIAVVMITITCSEDFLTKRAMGSVDSETLKNADGIEALLTTAYAYLTPSIDYGWGADPNNWVFGSIMGGDANKGSNSGDQPEINTLEIWDPLSNNDYLDQKWSATYDAIFACNSTIGIISQTEEDGTSVTAEFKAQKTAEAKFLRGFYFLELAKVFGTLIPYIDESYYLNNINNPIVANDVDIWSLIEADFTAAVADLPATQSEVGRATSWTAKAFLAKAYLYQDKYSAALTLFTDIINNGPYDLLPSFEQNFNVAYDNSVESIFAAQNTVADGTLDHANPGYSLAYPYGGPGGCCGFFQPSFSLVNSFKTNPDNGLPYLDTVIFNTNLKNDMNLTEKDAFTPDMTTPLDPRLDWSVGRRGIPYLNWGNHVGVAWIRDQQYGGPYSPIKNVYRDGDAYEMVNGWAPGSALNTNLFRYADLLLMAAECEVEAGTLASATDYVNLVRDRARNSTRVTFEDGTPAANYVIDIYTSDFPNAEYALKAIRYERKVELAMEGHRYFDLRRWGDDVITTELNSYASQEATFGLARFAGKTIAVPCALYSPIPVSEIELSNGVINQLNSGTCTY